MFLMMCQVFSLLSVAFDIIGYNALEAHPSAYLRQDSLIYYYSVILYQPPFWVPFSPNLGLFFS